MASLAVLKAHDLGLLDGASLRLKEGEHDGPGDLGRILRHDAEEDLQVERRRKQRVGPGTNAVEAKVVIDKGVTKG